MLQSKSRLDALDGWRTVAVLLVIVSHIITFSALHTKIPEAFQIAGDFGWLGVNFFFVISGFVICSALRKEFETYGCISLAAFYIRRCFRILPPLWCYLAVVAVLHYAGLLNTTLLQERNAAAFVCNFPAVDCGSWPVLHTWSLAYEEQFYILFPLALLLISPGRRRFFLAALAILPLAAIACYRWKQPFAADYLVKFQFLVTGVVLALYSEEIKPRLSKLSPLVVYPFVPTIFFVDHMSTTSPAIAVLKILTLAPLVGMVLFYTSHFACAAKNVLSYRGLVFVGRISYGVYLWQQLASGYYANAGIAFYTGALALTALICLVSFFWFEQPLIAFASRLSKARIERESPAKAAAGQVVAEFNLNPR